MFGDATAAKFLEKWPTVYKQKVLKQSRSLISTSEIQDLVQNAESSSDIEDGIQNFYITEHGFLIMWASCSGCQRSFQFQSI